MPHYHTSPKRLKEGKVLKPRSSSFVNSPKPTIMLTEDVLEAHRPTEALPRRRSVFASESSDVFHLRRVGGAMTWLYEVDMLGPTERNHTGWWNLINRAAHGHSVSETQQADWARAYWSGEECSDEISEAFGTTPGHWETRAGQLTIGEELSPSILLAGCAINHDGRQFTIYAKPGSIAAELMQEHRVHQASAGEHAIVFVALNHDFLRAEKAFRALQALDAASLPTP